MEPLGKNTHDLGPIYKVGVMIALLYVVWILGHKPTLTKYDIYYLLPIAGLCLAMWRPKVFDNAVKYLADKVPLFKFSKENGQ